MEKGRHTAELSVTEIEARIHGISEELKRPGIPYVERLMLHEDRKDLRAMLAARATNST